MQESSLSPVFASRFLSVVNKVVNAWGYKPAWQWWLAQLAMLVCLLLGIYLFWGHSLWQQHRVTTQQQHDYFNKIKVLKQNIARLSSLNTLNTLNTLNVHNVQPQSSQPQSITEQQSIEQHVAEALSYGEISLKKWKKQNNKNKLAGALVFNASYPQLLKFLHRLTTTHPTVDVANLTVQSKDNRLINDQTVANDLTVTVTLSEQPHQYQQSVGVIASTDIQTSRIPVMDVRDPFHPIAENSTSNSIGNVEENRQKNTCEPDIPPTASWRLQGTIGSGKVRYSWIKNSQGHIQRFNVGDVLTSTSWQITHIGVDYVQLARYAPPDHSQTQDPQTQDRQTDICENQAPATYRLELHKHETGMQKLDGQKTDRQKTDRQKTRDNSN